MIATEVEEGFIFQANSVWKLLSFLENVCGGRGGGEWIYTKSQVNYVL